MTLTSELKHHAVLVYENVLFAEGRSLAFRSPLNKVEPLHVLILNGIGIFFCILFLIRGLVYRLTFPCPRFKQKYLILVCTLGTHLNSLRTDGDFYHQGRDTEIAQKFKIVETY
jgi:hypothetical protein